MKKILAFSMMLFVLGSLTAQTKTANQLPKKRQQQKVKELPKKVLLP